MVHPMADTQAIQQKNAVLRGDVACKQQVGILQESRVEIGITNISVSYPFRLHAILHAF